MTKTPVILIHGAWHGSWCWKHIAYSLHSDGYDVYAPDLPGHYANMLPFGLVNLAKYVAEIQSLVENLSAPVILVGHSMAGIVISQVAENISGKIKRLVYVTGFVPENHGSLVEEEEKALKRSVGLELIVKEKERLIDIKHSPKVKHLFYNTCEEEDISYALKNIQDTPLQPFLDKVSLSPAKFGKVAKTYIECLEDNAISIEDQRCMYSKIQCDVITLKCDHSPFFSAKQELVEVLESIADEAQSA